MCVCVCVCVYAKLYFLKMLSFYKIPILYVGNKSNI